MTPEATRSIAVLPAPRDAATQSTPRDTDDVGPHLGPGADASSRPLVLAFATQGGGHGDEHRLLELLAPLAPHRLHFDRRSKVRSAWRIAKAIRRQRPAVVVMEGTGVGGGLAVVAGRLLAGVPYVVSSGDAVSPFLSAKFPLGRPVFAAYERLLCRLSAGFIGWTPYLAGRALTFGAPRAMTAAGWASFQVLPGDAASARTRLRDQLGISQKDVVFGIVGSLDWNRRYGYCYGYELVAAAREVRRDDLKVVIVGDGSGRQQLERLAGPALGKSVLFVGRVPHTDVPDYLAALDVGSLPQTVDCVGSFRYTIKLSEYLAMNLPVATGQIPLAYDLDDGWLWRLQGRSPWDDRYVRALRELMETVTPEQIRVKRAAVPAGTPLFSKEAQVRRVTIFLQDVIGCVESRE